MVPVPPHPSDPGYPCPRCRGTDTFTYAGPGGPDFICFTCLYEDRLGARVVPASVAGAA